MKKLITEKDILAAVRSGTRRLEVLPNALITPLARDRAKELGIVFAAPSEKKELPSPDTLTIVIGSDHSGFAAKAELKKLLTEKNYRVIDVGTDSETSCDYPDFALKVGEALKDGRATFGIMIDGVGTASGIVLNKIPRVRAAVCYNEFTATIARSHGNANALSLGARSLGIEVLKSVTLTFLMTAFEGERHATRLGKLDAIEKKFLQ
jgi:ribose 5-phosphate isomerase B